MIDIDLSVATPAEKRRERHLVVSFVADRDRGCRARTLVPDIRCGGPHDPHEIIPRSAWRDGIYDRDNVIEICRNHHRWVDREPDLAHARGLHGYSWEVPS